MTPKLEDYNFKKENITVGDKAAMKCNYNIDPDALLDGELVIKYVHSVLLTWFLL